MTQQLWTSVDQYLTDALVKPDEALDAALRDSDAAGLPPINVTPITLEAEPRHAEVATANIARAGLANRVEVRVGRALVALMG
jgi:predicted O-methyltransferase YrrM